MNIDVKYFFMLLFSIVLVHNHTHPFNKVLSLLLFYILGYSYIK